MIVVLSILLQLAVEVNGQHTDIHCSVFTNHLYIVVTQFCKFGTLVNLLCIYDICGIYDM